MVDDDVVDLSAGAVESDEVGVLDQPGLYPTRRKPRMMTSWVLSMTKAEAEPSLGRTVTPGEGAVVPSIVV